MFYPHAIGYSLVMKTKECQFSRLHDDEVPVPVGFCVCVCVFVLCVLGGPSAWLIFWQKTGDGNKLCPLLRLGGEYCVVWRCSFMAGKGLIRPYPVKPTVNKP